ncbi:unnamed protein product [Mytilus edulis]|uniref:Uncharacterized protein n=1 Tax=Mytilus edulis TaxID=6550 RepID=A0A8S3SGA1_MYTED|nr:unnamed protein product [Mytilus edulis]
MFCALSVEGATYGQHCTINANCTDDENICVGNNCTCSSTAFRRNNTECATKIDLNAVCGESTDICADSLQNVKMIQNTNAYAKTIILKIKLVSVHHNLQNDVFHLFYSSPGHRTEDPKHDNVIGIAFNVTCDNTDSAASQCSQANMGCLNDGSGIYRCLCNSDYYESNGTCYGRMKPYEACDDGQCVVHATCNVGNCTCDIGYEASPIVSPTQCNGAGEETVPILYILAMVKVLSQILISF